MNRRSLLTIGLTLLLSSLLPTGASARCRPALGYTLARVTDGPVAPGATVLVVLRPVYVASEAVTFPLTAINVSRGRHSESIPLRALASNLFAFEMPSAVGHYTISPTSLAIDVDASAVAPAAITEAPALGSAPLTAARIGTGTYAPSLSLSRPAPAASVGTLLHWGTSSFFVMAGDSLITPGRCVPEVPGYVALATGDRATVRFLNAAGASSPEVSFTARLPTH